MIRAGEKDTAGRVYVPAPYQDASQTNTGAILGLWVFLNEEIDWTWFHGPNGSYITGYTIKSRTPELPKTTCGMERICMEGLCGKPATHIWHHKDGDIPVCDLCVLSVAVCDGKLTKI
jgi:hypothetical protein